MCLISRDLQMRLPSPPLVFYKSVHKIAADHHFFENQSDPTGVHHGSDAAGASALRMTLTLKLLGPDVPQDFSISVESSLTVTQVKECAREKWPDGVCAPANQRSTRN